MGHLFLGDQFGALLIAPGEAGDVLLVSLHM